MDNLIDVFKDESYTCSLSQEPVTLAQAKAQCRVDFTDDDDYITTLISQCRAAIETYCNISIVVKTISITIANNYGLPQDSVNRYGPIYSSSFGAQYISRWDLNFFGYGMAGKWFRLPYGPIRAITSVTMISQANPPVVSILTLNTDYFLRGAALPGSFQEIMIPNWSNNCLIVYYAGYLTVPSDLKLAILNEIAFRYESRGDATNRYAQQNVGICEAARVLADKYIDIQV